MTPLTLTLLLITGLFISVLVVKKFVHIRLCAICAAVSGSWITLLLLRVMDVAVDPVLLSLLIGQSIVGVYYLAEKHAPEGWQLFRLPFLLSLTLLAYTVLSPDAQLWQAYLYISILWIAFGVLYNFNRSPRAAKAVKSILECCKNW